MLFSKTSFKEGPKGGGGGGQTPLVQEHTQDPPPTTVDGAYTLWAFAGTWEGERLEPATASAVFAPVCSTAHVC